MKESIDFLVNFHKSVTFTRGFDGLYVDMLTNEWFIGARNPLLRWLGDFFERSRPSATASRLPDRCLITLPPPLWRHHGNRCI
jgi:hypothetical protein